jgi:hypothetical protein
MKAHEILVESVKPSLKKLVQVAQGTWYETNYESVNWWYTTMYGTGLDHKLNVTPDSLLYMFVPKGKDAWDWGMNILSMQDKDLTMVAADSYMAQDLPVLQALVDKVGALTGTRLYGDLVVYDGKVYVSGQVFTTMPQKTDISGQPVYEVPASAWWILDKLHLTYHKKSDQILVFWHKELKAWCCVSIKQNKVMAVSSTAKLNLHQAAEISLQIAKKLGLKLSETSAHYVTPDSIVHKVLQIMQDDPGVARTDLYWKKLQQKKLPTHKGSKDQASQLVHWGLASESITNLGPITYTITAKGKMVLAALNSGKKVPLSGLIKVSS